MTAAEYQNPDRRLERFRGFDHLLAQRGDITNSIASGTKMWMNTSRVKKRLPSVLGCRKFRAIGSPKSGSVSSHSVVATATYWASSSQTTQ